MLFPVLLTPYEAPLDVEQMAQTGKCSRCDVDMQLLNVEINLLTRMQVYWYRCTKCESVINTDVLLHCNLPC
jgi:hypothetical protein